MLTRLRKGAKSLTAKILIALLVVSFAVWGIGDIFSFRLDSRIGQVGDTEVSAQSFADALLREQSRITRQAGELITLEAMRSIGLDRRILGGLMRDAAFQEELSELGISAPHEAVADAIRQNPAFQDPGGKFSRQGYQFVLNQQRFSEQQFEELTRTVIAQQILTETVQAGALPPPGVAARVAAWQGETRAVTILTLTPDMAPDPGAPDEGALRGFYDANTDMFTEPERRSGQYLHVDAEKLLKELAPDEATLRHEYEARRADYRVEPTRTLDQITMPDRASADAAMARLLAGEVTFDELGAERGVTGDDLSLGTVARGDLPGAAADLVFGTKELGLAGPVDLPAGVAIYRIREATEGGATPFEEVREQIAEDLARDKMLVRAPEIANQVEELRAEGQTMDAIAEQTGAAFGRFEGLALDGTLPGGAPAEGVLASDPFLAEAFAAVESEERDLIETTDGGYLLVMVQRIKPSALQPFEDARARVAAAWEAAERLKAVEAQGAALAQRLGTDASIWDLADELGVAALPLVPFTRLKPPAELPAELVEKMFETATSGGVSAARDDGSVVAQVTSVTALAPDAVASASAALDQRLSALLKDDMSEYFARAIEARHDARIEPGVIDEVFRRLGGSRGGN